MRTSFYYLQYKLKCFKRCTSQLICCCILFLYFVLKRSSAVILKVSKMVGNMKNYVDLGTHFREKIQMLLNQLPFALCNAKLP